MDYLVNVYKGLGFEDGRKEEPAGSYIMQADSELEASNNYFNSKEFREILNSFNGSVDHHVTIENQYLKNLDVTVHISGTADRPLDEYSHRHIHAGDITFRGKNGRGGAIWPKEEYPDVQITGEKTFEASFSGYISDEGMLRLSDCTELRNSPIYTDTFPGSFMVLDFESDVTIVDRNPNRGNEMEEWGEPEFDKDGNAVYKAKIDLSLIGVDLEDGDDFAKAVGSIPIEDGQSLE